MANSYFDLNTPDIVLKSLYTKYDTDESGHLKGEELCRLLVDDLGLSESQAHAYTLLLDKDGSNAITFDEFKAWLNSGEKCKNVDDSSRFSKIQKAVEMFRKYDVDGSQSLGREEYGKLHVDVAGNPDHVDSALAALDKDGNGVISFYEFLKWLNWVPLEEF